MVDVVIDGAFSPDRTSIRQVASGVKKGVRYGYLHEGMFVVDYGGGRYDDGVNYLAEYGIEAVVYDPYSRSPEDNLAVIEEVTRRGGADCVMLHNVLNVIPEFDERCRVIQLAWGMVRPGGVMLITVYRGNGSGIGSRRDFGDGMWTWQENRPYRDYLPEIADALPMTVDIDVKHEMVIITDEIQCSCQLPTTKVVGM